MDKRNGAWADELIYEGGRSKYRIPVQWAKKASGHVTLVLWEHREEIACGHQGKLPKRGAILAGS